MRTDPFAHHPELRGLIKDPLTSFFRDLSLDTLQETMDAHGLEGGWWYSDAQRTALWDAFFNDRPKADLWVFGYGSLMSDPGVLFAEVRRARLPGHARKFILQDVHGGRGTAERPGLMAALDTSNDDTACEGLAFRISADLVEDETRRLWQREMVAPGYLAVMTTALIDDRAVPVHTFLADHASDAINSDINRDEQVRLIATGTGFLGSSREYLENIDRQFTALGIHDPEVTALLAEVQAHASPSN